MDAEAILKRLKEDREHYSGSQCFGDCEKAAIFNYLDELITELEGDETIEG